MFKKHFKIIISSFAALVLCGFCLFTAGQQNAPNSSKLINVSQEKSLQKLDINNGVSFSSADAAPSSSIADVSDNNTSQPQIIPTADEVDTFYVGPDPDDDTQYVRDIDTSSIGANDDILWKLDDDGTLHISSKHTQEEGYQPGSWHSVIYSVFHVVIEDELNPTSTASWFSTSIQRNERTSS